MPRHHINVRREGKLYRLYNHDFVAGDRLFKGEDPTKPSERWPFSHLENWTTYPKKKDAEVAAEKLQSYLEARENRKKKKGDNE